MLEEYLTEAGLHALDAEEGRHGADAAHVNFSELALLVYHSACLYRRKVNYLYMNVLVIRESLKRSAMSVRRPNLFAAARCAP